MEGTGEREETREGRRAGVRGRKGGREEEEEERKWGEERRKEAGVP